MATGNFARGGGNLLLPICSQTGQLWMHSRLNSLQEHSTPYMSIFILEKNINANRDYVIFAY